MSIMKKYFSPYFTDTEIFLKTLNSRIRTDIANSVYSTLDFFAKGYFINHINL